MSPIAPLTVVNSGSLSFLSGIATVIFQTAYRILGTFHRQIRTYPHNLDSTLRQHFHVENTTQVYHLLSHLHTYEPVGANHPS